MHSERKSTLELTKVREIEELTWLVKVDSGRNSYTAENGGDYVRARCEQKYEEERETKLEISWASSYL